MDLCTCHGFNVYDGTHLADGYFWCEVHDPRAVYELPAKREREPDEEPTTSPKILKRVRVKKARPTTSWTPVLCEKLGALMRQNAGDLGGSGVERAEVLVDLWDEAIMGVPAPSHGAIARHITTSSLRGGIHRCYQTAQCILNLYQ